MTKLEVQYAVRQPDGRGGWLVLSDRWARRHTADTLARIRSDGAEVVAQVVMVAVDWTDPDTAEGVVRDEQDRERAYQTWDVDPELFVLRRRTPEGRRAYLDAKRAELETAGKDTEIIDLIEEVNGDGP